MTEPYQPVEWEFCDKSCIERQCIQFYSAHLSKVYTEEDIALPVQDMKGLIHSFWAFNAQIQNGPDVGLSISFNISRATTAK